MKLSVTLIFFAVVSVLSIPVGSEEPEPCPPTIDRYEQLRQKIAELDKKKLELRKKAPEVRKQHPKKSGKTIEDIITRYEKLLDNCTQRKIDRCADVIYTLGGLYYEIARDNFREAVDEYKTASADTAAGIIHVIPSADFSRCLFMYDRLIREYPDFPKLGEAYGQIASIYQITCNADMAMYTYTIYTLKYRKSHRSFGSIFTLAENSFKHSNYITAGKLLDCISKGSLNGDSWLDISRLRSEIVRMFPVEAYERHMNRIQEIIELSVGIEETTDLLNRLEMQARRDIIY